MLILGKNSDDKGTQLENLTRSILFTLGYTNIVANEIRSGAEEIDVSAERQFPAIRGVQVAELICECKAYKKPVDINDWLKFLGKLFTAEKCQSQTVYGCFVALNGVKGSVAGHYKNLAYHTNIITLVSGEDLFKRVSEIYNLCDLKKVKIAIQSFTNRQVISFEEVAYYENQVFRIIIFEKDAYTIFCSDGQPINKEIYNSTLREAAEFVLPTMNFIDLQEEAEALRKAIRIEKMVLSQLFLDGGRTTGSISHTDEFTESEVCNAINNCIEKSWITRSGSSEEVYLVSENDENYYVILADIYRFLLSGETTEPVLKALGSDYHRTHINDKMISEIQKIQGNLSLTPEEIQQVILLLMWSPTALAWSLYPDAMLTNYPIQRDLVDSNTRRSADLICRNYFLGVLYSLFKRNFQHPELHAQFYLVYGLREIEILEKLIVKSSTGIELQGELPLRQAIVQMDMTYIGSDKDEFVMIIPFASSPQPWQSSTTSNDTDIES